MHHFDIRKWTRLGYVVLLVALATTWMGCAPTVPPISGSANANANGNGNDNGNANTNTNGGGTECGNGVVEDGEQCEPPGSASCDADCQTISVGGPVCGNGVVEDGEECEPPESALCDADCQMITVGGADCGNGEVEAGEECEPPNSASCDADCQTISVGGAECGNGEVEDGEECEPPDTETCDANCQTVRAPAVCGNDVVEEGERCDPPDGILCDDNCQTISTGGSDCGNEIVEPGEQCDPPDGDTCDANCQTTTGGGLANDSCASPTAITEGSHSFTNVGATTDGPQACAPFDNPQIDSDIWYCFTAPCTEPVTFSLCGSGYDTKMAVYLGCDCPDSGNIWLGCSDDDCGAGQESRTTLPGLAGQDYLIRIGGFRGFDDEQGAGTLTIFCESDPDHGLVTCAPGAGDCFTDNGTPGCSDAALCEATCAADASCCDRVWDDLCATKADGIANGFDVCGPGNGSCNEDEGTPGCDDADCCQSVCEADPFCCLTNWDDVCGDAVPGTCGVLQACVGARGTCDAEHDSPACNIESCCVFVCEADPLCCTDRWDEICVESAESCEP